MLTVKCPHCGAGMKLKQAPASGKVKCPKCSKVVDVNAPAAAAPSAAPAARTIDPDDEAFDFGRISVPTTSGSTAVTHFPVGDNMQVYEGPIPGDPLEAAVEEEEGEEEAKPTSPYHLQDAEKEARPKATKKRNPKVLIGAIAGVGVLLIGGVVAVAMSGGGGGGGPSSAEMIAAAQSSAPEGYSAVGIDGCIVLMPKGSGYDKLPSAMESNAVMSTESESVYFLGAMNGGTRELDTEQMRKKAARSLGGDILGGQETERNGYKGIKGVLDGSVFLPRMQVEIFHHDERFVIIGCAPASMSSTDGQPTNRKAEEAEQKIFYGSFKIGPRPSGWFW